MRLTKYTHSCIRFDNGSDVLVIDPGVFSEVQPALDGAKAVLITHEHADHLNAPALLEAARANPSMRVWAPAPVAASLSELGDRVTTVGSGESFDAGGFAVSTFGDLHALNHPLIGPPVANIGYLIEGAVFHPGDSFTVPTEPVEVLMAPIHAPWSKVGEVLDYAIAVRAPRVFQLHDGLLNEIGGGMVDTHLSRIAGLYGSTYKRLAPAESVEI
jgi:L-ascorbate metabolism protein UlaG (beta-lactamase superfamily)